jgi:hypothetical protein
MGLLDNAGKNAGQCAAEELHATVKDAIPAAQMAADEIITRTANEIVTQAAGALTQAAGSMEIALGALPDSIVEALDGLTISVSPITVTIRRKQ